MRSEHSQLVVASSNLALQGLGNFRRPGRLHVVSAFADEESVKTFTDIPTPMSIGKLRTSTLSSYPDSIVRNLCELIFTCDHEEVFETNSTM